VDMNNSHALKGDDSDGKVEWSIRSIFAAIFLAALYTGLSLSPTQLYHIEKAIRLTQLPRLPSHPLLHGRFFVLHRRRPRSSTWVSLAPYS
jgi:hypothetical protein